MVELVAGVQEEGNTDSIALFVAGHSPAIITETLAALSARGEAGRVCEVRVCTTATGARIIREALFENGGWTAFLREYPAFRHTRFSPRSVEAPDDLDDIRDEADNRAIAESILTRVREATDGEARVLASIAGGRKTMGYYLGFAMSLFGRPEDRLTHVLVPRAWERDRGFLFPASDEADRVDLVDVPFIRIRNHLGPALRDLDVERLLISAQSTVDLAALQPITLRIKRRSVEYLGRSVEFGERDFSILQFFAEQKLKHCRAPEAATCGDCHGCFLSPAEAEARKEELFNIRVQFGGVTSAHYEKFVNAWSTRGAFGGQLPEPIRRIRAAVENVHGIDPRAEALTIRNVGSRGSPAYGLMADKSQIRIERR